MGLLSIFRPKAAQSAPTATLKATPPAQRAETSTAPRTANVGFRGYYEALNDSPDRTPIPAYAHALKQVIAGLDRERLARVADYLYDNDGLVGFAVGQIANYSTPIIPMAASPSAEWNKKAEAFFHGIWAKQADFTGRHDFDTLQRLASIGIDTRGEAAPLMTEENGLPQIQFVHPWLINSQKVTDPKVRHIDGVRVTEKGAILGFYVQKDVVSNPEFISANEMILLYDPERYENYRGITPMRRGMNDIRDRKDIKGFEKLATKISSALAAVIEGADYEEEDNWATDNGNDDLQPPGDITGNQPPANATPQEKAISMADLLGGDIPVLPEGKKLNQLDNNRPGERVLEMLSFLGGAYVSGLGLPPAFLIDEKLTGPNQRNVNGKAQRKFDDRQRVLGRFVEWVWVRVIGWAIAKGILPAQEGWDSIEWQGPPKVSIDEGKDATSWRADVGLSLMTRQNHFANRQLNWRREADQGFSEDDYIIGNCRVLADKWKIPIEWVLVKWGYVSAIGAPSPEQPQPDQNQNETNQPPPN